MTIGNLTPGTAYEFQVFGKNALGEGVHSNIFTIKTEGNNGNIIMVIIVKVTF